MVSNGKESELPEFSNVDQIQYTMMMSWGQSEVNSITDYMGLFYIYA